MLLFVPLTLESPIPLSILGYGLTETSPIGEITFRMLHHLFGLIVLRTTLHYRVTMADHGTRTQHVITLV